MKKIYLLVLTAIAATASWADSRSTQEMLRIAQQKLGTSVTEVKTTAEARTLNNVKGSPTESQAYTTFNAQNGNGFVIVGADNRLPEILGYSTTGTLTAENMPPQLSAILQNLNAALPYMKDTYQASEDASYTPVDSLCTALWAQDGVFSAKCPKYYSSEKKDSVHCASGCTATALAQVIYYWGKQGKFPTTGSGIYHWTSKKAIEGTDTLNLPLYYDFSTPLDFKNMKDTYFEKVSDSGYTPAEEAVAEIMKMCGALVKIKYGKDSDSFLTFLDRCEKFYGFGKGARVVRRGDYTNEEWEKMIVDQIEKHYPVLYGGNTIDGGNGHAFILDGISSDGLFHLNWGWNGSCNLFFDINYLNPHANYTGGSDSDLPYDFNNSAIIDFAPDENDQVSEYFAKKLNLVLEKKELQIEGFSTSSHVRQGVKVVLRITPTHDKDRHTFQTLNQEMTDQLVPDSVQHNPYANPSTVTNLPLDFFSKYEDGYYYVDVITQDPEQSGYSVVRTPGNQYQQVHVTVSGGKVVDGKNRNHDLRVKGQFQYVNLPRANRYVTFNVKVSADSLSCNNLMTMIAIQKEEEMSRTADKTVDSVVNSVKAKMATYMAVNLEAYQDTTYQLKATMPPTPGTYKVFMLCHTDNINRSMSDTIEVEVKEPLLEDVKYALYDENGNENPKVLTDLANSPVKFTAKANGAYEKLALKRILLVKNYLGAFKDTAYVDSIYFKNKAKGDLLEESYNFRSLTNGQSFAITYNIGVSGTNDFDIPSEAEYIVFEYKKGSPSAIQEVEATSATASGAAYDLSGRPVDPQTYRGIMIQNGRKRVAK